MAMEHPVAGAHTVERYLLDELAPDERESFEAHCFTCCECADDLKATAAFLAATRRELRRTQPAYPAEQDRRADQEPRTAQPAQSRQLLQRFPAGPARARRAPWFAFLGRPAFLSPVAALLLLTVLYQNLVRVPGPEIPPAISLIGAGSRGGGVPSGTLDDGDSLLLSFDVPAAEGITGYSAELVDPAGRTRWRLSLPADRTQDTITLRVPPSRWTPGAYTLVLLGQAAGVPASTPLARYKFVVQAPR